MTDLDHLTHREYDLDECVHDTRPTSVSAVAYSIGSENDCYGD